jgi:hypothetical protein|nr:MAG TPA_asm: putative cytoplasmic protein [Caudoviricetes sp.]
MYVCLDCQKTFETPKYWMDKHGLDSPPYETWRGCPYCGGTYVEAMLCDGCGEPITGEYVEIFPEHEVYCENCFIMKDIED